MRYPMLDGWVRLVRRRWVAGLLLFVVVALTGSAFVLLSRSVYRAESRLRLGEPPPMSGVSPTASVLGLMRLGGDPFANDLELLASRTLAEHVVDDVALHVRLGAPRGWHRDSVLVSLAAGRATARAAFDVRWTGDTVEITAPRHDRVRGRAGDVLEFGDVRAVFRPWRQGMPRRVTLATVPHAQAARELSGGLRVERTRRDANVVRVSYQGPDPRVTHDIVASAVTRFVALRTWLLQRESGETVDSLRSVALRTKQELAAAEASLQEVQRRTGLIAPEAQAEAWIERYADLLVQLERARMESSALDHALVRSAGSADAAGSWAALLAYPRFLENETVGGLLTQLTELEQLRRELARRRTSENIELQVVHDRIAHLDQSLRTVASDFATTLRNEVDAAERQTRAMQGQLATVPANMIEFGRRQRELRILSEITVVTEQRLRQEELRQALTFANVQVIDPPALRDRPVWPRRKLGPAVAVLIAGLTALGGIIVMERADRGVRTAAQVGRAVGAPVVAVVRADGKQPLITPADAAVLFGRAARPGANGARRLALVDIAGDVVAPHAADALAVHTTSNGGAAHVDVLAPVGSYGAASAAAATGVPLFLVIRAGATTDAAAARAAALLRDAGCDIAGAVVVCRDARAAAEVWS